MKGVQEYYMKDILKNKFEYDYDILDEIGLPPVEHKGSDYNIRALVNYCKINNISLESLTENELKQFEIK